MIGNDSIDLSLSNIWQSWFNYRKGKKYSPELHEFQYNLEENLYQLFLDLNEDTYRHQGYKTFVVSDNKKREISVASIRDRIVHRLIYDCLNPIYDKIFIYDAWSCRLNKGLIGAIERTQQFLSSYPDVYIWRADIKKFFDSVNRKNLLEIISLRIKDEKALKLIKEVINSFSKKEGQNTGMPIGNLTSQIFANIYLNELDRFVKHSLKPRAYLRYGDDFVILSQKTEKLSIFREKVIDFLKIALKLKLNPKNNIIIKAKHGLRFLGVIIYPKGRKLNKRNQQRVKSKLNHKNIGSYFGLVQKHSNKKRINNFRWQLLKFLN